MTLHLLSTSNPDKLNNMQSFLQTNDLVILLADAVYLAASLSLTNPLYARSKDIAQRGLTPAANLTLITDEQWVELTLSHQPVVHWHD